MNILNVLSNIVRGENTLFLKPSIILTKLPEMVLRVFRVKDQNSTFLLILANIKMNIKIYWPKTQTHWTKKQINCIVQNHK